MSYNYCFKFIIIGDTAVGKSCILYQFLEQKFRTKHEMTVGVEFGAKMLEIDKKKIKVQIWDTAGQEAFKSITRQYYKSAAGAILVYDITRKESFDNIKDWIRECTTHGSQELRIILVGNKCDLDKQRKVSRQEGEQLANSHGYLFLETSAKSNINISDIFTKASEQIYGLIQQNAQKELQGVRLGLTQQSQGQQTQEPKKRCC